MDKSKNIVPYLILLSILGYTLNILFHRYLTHHMSADLYGDFSIGLNILDIIATLLLLGTEISVTKFLPLIKERTQEKKYISWNYNFLKKPLFLYMVLLIAIFIAFNIAESQFQGFVETLHISIIMLFIAPFVVFYGLLLSYLNSKNKLLDSALLDSIGRYVFLFIFFILIFSVLEVKVSSTAIVLIYIAAYFLLGLIALSIYGSKFSSLNPLEYIFQKEQTYEKSKEWRKVSLEYAFSSIIFLIFLYIDKLILEFVHPEEEVVGYYSVLVVLVGLFTLISRSLTPFIAPHISEYVENRELRFEFQAMINRSNLFLFLLSLFLFLVYCLEGKEILGFYGKKGEYSIVYPALIYLAISQIFLEVGRLGLRFLLYSGYTKYINRVFVFSIICLLVLGVILTYFYGLYGMIAAHLISSFIYMTAYILKVRKEFGDIKVFSVF